MGRFRRVFALVCSLLSLGAGLVIAGHHPVAPVLTVVLFCLASILFFARPVLGLPALVVLLPVLNFSPWTGWLMIDEFDLLVLSILGAGYLRICRNGLRLQDHRLFLGVLAVAALLVVRVASGIDFSELSAFADYSSPVNGLRVAKSVFWIALLIPVLSPHLSGGNSAEWSRVIERRFMVAGLISLSLVMLAVLWERGFYPGIVDFATPYRTVALFWEMHVGGAALDIYLVLMAPLLLWAWRSARSTGARVVCGVLILVFVYACLTTYSRAMITSILGSLFLLALILIAQRAHQGQVHRLFSLTGGAVLGLVVLEVMLIAGADSYLNERLSASERDLGGRFEHWQRGARLLQTPMHWFFGIGPGALPTALIRGDSGLPVTGAIKLNIVSERSVVVLSGPDSGQGLRAGDGFYFLSQRVDLRTAQGYRLALDAFSERRADVLVKLCAMHLLYPARCRDRIIHLNGGGWQRSETGMLRTLFDAGQWQASGHGVLMLSVLTPGATVSLGRVELLSAKGNLLSNAQFDNGFAAWFPVARFYFLPWHIDNLYLEILVEAGLFGLLCFATVVFGRR